MHGLRTLTALALVFASPAAHAADQNWPQFRGPTADGHAASHGLPLTWAENKNVVWKTPIHDKGWSSPVIWGKQVWLTTANGSVEKRVPEDGKRLYGVCVDKDTGKIIYDIKLFDVEKPGTCFAYNSYASPTPVIEEGRVYLHFGSPGTACVDTTTGKILWKRNDLPCDHWRAAGSSPILFENLLILTFDGHDFQYVAALDKMTGKTVWKKDRNITTYRVNDGDMKKAYSTPAVITVEGRQQLVSPSAEATIAYDPRTGEELWRVKHGGMNAASLPVYGHGLVYVTTAAGGDQLVAIKPEVKNPPPGKRIDWSFKKNVPSRPSPLLVGDYLYMVSDGGVLSCVNAKTGELIGSVVRLNRKFSASPIYAEGRIYVVSEDGPAFVVEAKPEMKVLAVNELDGNCMASPAVSGKALFLRTRTHLYRIEEK